MQDEGKVWDRKVGCPYLVAVGDIHRCGIFLQADEAKRAAMTDDMGIGAGCSSTMFNDARNRILARMRAHEPKPSL